MDLYRLKLDFSLIRSDLLLPCRFRSSSRRFLQGGSKTLCRLGPLLESSDQHMLTTRRLELQPYSNTFKTRAFEQSGRSKAFCDDSSSTGRLRALPFRLLLIITSVSDEIYSGGLRNNLTATNLASNAPKHSRNIFSFVLI